MDIVLKNYNDLSDIERCQHYIVYKTISICGTYPEYRDAMDEIDRGWNNDGLVFGTSGIADVIEHIKNDKTHVTLKLRQCTSFINNRKEKGFNFFEENDNHTIKRDSLTDHVGTFLICFDDLKKLYNIHDTFPLELLPPPIYKVDILYRSGTDNHRYIPYMYLSSGEKQLLNNIGALIYHLRNLDSVTDGGRLYENVNVIFEEIELYFHPEYQRLIVKTIIEKLQDMTFKHVKRINITFVTHSPFILSDIPLCNVLFLKNGIPSIERMQENTFGANIHGMLRNGFFLPSLPIGEFAHEKINNLFERLTGYKLDVRSREQKEWFYSTIMRIGEPYLREQLMKLYNMHYPVTDNDRS